MIALQLSFVFLCVAETWTVSRGRSGSSPIAQEPGRGPGGRCMISYQPDGPISHRFVVFSIFQLLKNLAPIYYFNLSFFAGQQNFPVTAIGNHNHLEKRD